MDSFGNYVTARVITALVVVFSVVVVVIYRDVQSEIIQNGSQITELNGKLNSIAVDSIGDQLNLQLDTSSILNDDTTQTDHLNDIDTSGFNSDVVLQLIETLTSLSCIAGETLSFTGELWDCGSLPEPSILGASTQISSGDGLWNSGSQNSQVWNVGVDNSSVQMLNNLVTVRESGITESKISDGAITSSKIDIGAVIFDHIDGSSCSTDDVIKWDGAQWNCETIAGGVTESEIEGFIFDAENTGTLSSGTLALDSLNYTGDLNDAQINDALTIAAGGSVADGALSSNVTLLGQTITFDDLTNTGDLGFTWDITELDASVIEEGENISLLNNDAGYLTSVGLIGKDGLNNTRTLSFDWEDSEVADDLTISATGSIDDGALSANVSLLGVGISRDELVDSGVLGFSWNDSEISDAISISELGSIDDGALSVNVSLLGATISKDELTDSGVIGFTWSTSELDSAVIVEGENISLLNNDAGYLTSIDTVSTASLDDSGTLSFDWVDAEVDDALTISASGSVADGALSANVSLLGATISKDELIGTGAIAFIWSDAEIADDLTISSSGSVDDGALSANVSLLGSEIALDSEVSGTLPLEDGGTGSNLADPDADVVLFWDDTGGAIDWLSVGSNVQIVGGVLSANDEYSGTVTEVIAGNGLSGGTISSSGSIAITSETCGAGEKLIWNGTAFICDSDADTTYIAGNDLDLSGDTFNIESQLDFVSVISQDSANLTLQTTTSGDILFDPVGNVGIDEPTPGTKLDVNGTTRMTGFNLSTSPADGYVLTSDDSGNGSWQPIVDSGGIGTVYSGTTSETGVIIWNGQVTTNSSGVATFNVTSDGTGSGTSIFTNIYSIQATAEYNTSLNTAVPLAGINTVSGDNKTITVNVVEGTGVILGGHTLEFSPSGRNVYLTIIGD